MVSNAKTCFTNLNDTSFFVSIQFFFISDLTKYMAHSITIWTTLGGFLKDLNSSMALFLILLTANLACSINGFTLSNSCSTFFFFISQTSYSRSHSFLSLIAFECSLAICSSYCNICFNLFIAIFCSFSSSSYFLPLINPILDIYLLTPLLSIYNIFFLNDGVNGVFGVLSFNIPFILGNVNDGAFGSCELRLFFKSSVIPINCDTLTLSLSNFFINNFCCFFKLS
mmetsp:Transcript_78745/g.96295  ORF Transcript_78745/g.96295 Transcript_78745/m.96295 type:complete len:226 (+) Transcript_78745:379-1056(+)